MIISQTPLRCSIVGGGTDLKSYYSIKPGYVISSAIDKYIYVIIKERFDKKIYINCLKREIVDKVEEIHHDLIREAMKITGIENGVEITVMADIPSEGSGLGSSSSLTVGLLNAFYNYKGILPTKEWLAQDACKIEIDILKKPIGRQDQYIAAYGGLNLFKFYQDRFIDDRTIQAGEFVDVTKLSITDEEKRKLSNRLMLFYTGQTRSSNEILSEQTKNMPKLLTSYDNLVCLAKETYEQIKCGNFMEVGKNLHKGWLIKKTLASTISNTFIDDMYDKALYSSAIGGKLCGAGSSGFFLLYCEPEFQDKVRKELSEYRELPFSLGEHGTRIVFNIKD